MSFEFPNSRIEGINQPKTIIQGGMGALVSGPRLSGEVARLGGVGVVSSIGLDRRITGQLGNHFEAAKLAIEEAISLSDGNGMIGINCMAHMHTCNDSVRGAIAGKVGAIFIGAGLHRDLPQVVGTANVGLVPIVSSARALRLICECWNKFERRPNAAVLEGPLAGGHLGFKPDEITNPDYSLENLLPQVLTVANEYGGFPIIVAGGIFYREDIIHWTNFGAAGVQLGTIFLATHESGASPAFKRAVVEVNANEIVVAINPGSPAELPFRVIGTGFLEAIHRDKSPVCNLGYMVHGGTCKALDGSGKSFCICNKLLSAVDLNPDPRELPVFTVGVNAAIVKDIVSVSERMKKLTMIVP